MTINLLTELRLEFLSLKGGCTGSSESTPVKMPHCWKSHVTAQMLSSASQCVWVFYVLHVNVFKNMVILNMQFLNTVKPV